MSKVLAVILAGGQGERLSLLSPKRAKPAVPFAGKYRIIDFALSNCVNSGIFDVAVLTQYRPHLLNDHIGITLIGKRAHLPDHLKVGRNCKIGTDLRPEDFPSDTLASGETLEDRSFAHGWQRELARRTPPAPYMLPSKACGNVIESEGEKWKIEVRNKR
jgi:hypothetical protein